MFRENSFRLGFLLIWVCSFSIASQAFGAIPPALLEAFRNNQVAEVQAFLTAEPSAVDATDSEGETLLLKSANLGMKEMLQTLLRFKANPNISNIHGHFPLLLAAASGFGKIARDLIQGGADLEKTDPIGNTALHWAVIYGERRIAHILAKGSPINLPNHFGQTPLILAAMDQDLQMVNLLATHRRLDIDLENKDEKGKTAEDWLKEEKTSPALTECLLLLSKIRASRPSRDLTPHSPQTPRAVTLPPLTPHRPLTAGPIY